MYFFDYNFRTDENGNRFTNEATVSVIAGEHNTNQITPREQVRVFSPDYNSNIIVHREYNYPTRSNNDIALIYVDRPFELNDYVDVICLPEASDVVSVGTHCVTSGWGWVRKSQTSPTTVTNHC